MKKLLLIFSLLTFTFRLSFGQSWMWGAQGQISVKSDDQNSPVATDKKGNVYIAGGYSFSIDFGPFGFNDYSENVYLVKYNSAGVVQWAIQATQTAGSNSYATALATDTAGNVYMTGWLTDDTIKFGSFDLNCPYEEGGREPFLIKFDSNGNALWVQQAAVSSGINAYSTSVAVDNHGNSFITGWFQSLLYFNSDTLIPDYFQNVFLAKYDPNGNFLWAKQSNAFSSYSYGTGNSITTDNVGNAYLTGYYNDTIVLGSIMLKTTLNTTQAFIAKYDASGNVKWAKTSSGCGEGNSAVTDEAGNIYITGYFKNNIAFGPYNLTGIAELFLTKYDTNGNVIWAKQSTSDLFSSWYGTALARDGNNGIYMAGYGNGDTLRFGNVLLTGNGYPSFILKLDSSGNANCGSILLNGDFYSPVIIGAAADLTGQYVYLSGLFYNDSLKCGPDTLIAFTIDPYVARWKPCPNDEEGIPTITSQNANVVLYPNPSNGVFSVSIRNYELGNKNSVAIYNMLGEKVYSQLLIPNSSFLINLSSQPNGIYLYRITNETDQLIGDGKLIIQK